MVQFYNRKMKKITAVITTMEGSGVNSSFNFNNMKGLRLALLESSHGSIQTLIIEKDMHHF